MDKTALVSFDIDNGQRVLDAMEHEGIGPEAALWAVLPQYEDWCLVVASSRLSEYSRVGGYARINEALDKARIPFLIAPVIYLRDIDDSFIAGLREVFASAGDTYGMRLGGQKFGNPYIEEGFVYRIR